MIAYSETGVKAGEMSPLMENWRKLGAKLHVPRPFFPENRTQAVTLVAVSKGQPGTAMMPLLEAGQRDFGENRLQEAMVKWPALKRTYPDIRLHFIGALQSNKVKEALGLFDVIHTIDRESLVDALVKHRELWTSSEKRRFFIQVNTGEEVQKGGVSPSGLSPLLEYCAQQSLPVTGLMCIPPAAELSAPHFALLRTYADKHRLEGLSMGMSDDYETALQFGATHIRIGTALFGKRV